MKFDWSNFISSAIGALIGGFFAYLIAKWTLNKTIVMNYREFVYKYNHAQVFFKKFIEYSEELLNGTDKELYPFLDSDFLDMRNNFLSFIKELDKNFNIERNNELLNLFTLNEQAPPTLYKDLNGLIMLMAIIENQFYSLYKHRFNEEIGGLNLKGIDSNYDYLPEKHIKRLKKKNKKILKEIGI